MALQEFPNRIGIPLLPMVGGWPLQDFTVATTNVDAAGESLTFIGRVYLDTGVGTSKVMSSAGGKIYWRVGATTFANAGTNLRVGVQDVVDGVEDGTFDVYKDLVGGTDTITANTIITTAMASGTKTIAHGDVIAVSIEMTARGGSDVVQPIRTNSTSNFPYCTTDTGSGILRSGLSPCVLLEFDDGTIGHFGEHTIPFLTEQTSFGDASTPDEYALIFSCPFRSATNALLASIGEIDAVDTGEIILYSDPLGTPVAERTYTYDSLLVGIQGNAVGMSVFPVTEFTLEADTLYAVAFRPTSTNPRNLRRVTAIPTANTRKVLSLGTNFREGTRSDQTGAFTENTTSFPLLGCMLNKLDDGGAGPTDEEIAEAVWVYANRTLTE